MPTFYSELDCAIYKCPTRLLSVKKYVLITFEVEKGCRDRPVRRSTGRSPSNSCLPTICSLPALDLQDRVGPWNRNEGWAGT